MADVPMRLQPLLADRYPLELGPDGRPVMLGRGGMATVYLARDSRHNRRVALKLLHPELTAALGAERFLREIEIVASLTHPHILPLHDSGTLEVAPGSTELYYVMPYVEGESLRVRLRRERQLPLGDALRIAREVADALDCAHRHGVVHRDIKPENILLEEGHAVVADFGIARAIAEAGGERLTGTGLALGTPSYMSPEQALGERYLDGRTDIYALGCVLYEMLAGEPPYTGPTAQAIVAKRLAEPVPHLSTIRDVPPAVELVVARALARAPADRFATAAEFGAGIGAVEGLPRLPVEGPRVRTRPARRSWIRIGGVVLSLAALAAGGVLLSRPRSSSSLDPNLLAVAPFDVLDPSLELWREGLVDILSRDLDGAGPLRTVSQTVALKRWKGRADRLSAEAFGGRTGAGLVVFGSVVRKGGDSVSLRATVVDLVGNRTEPDLEVVGAVDRLGELADSLGFRALQGLGRGRLLGAVRQVSLGSRSLPALKAFLRGEQFYRRGLWDSALVHYDQAIARDSTFALAFRRMGLVLGWRPPTSGTYRDQEEYTRRAVLLNRGLSPKDSLLIAASSLSLAANDATVAGSFTGSYHRSLAALEEAVRRYPDDPEVWYALGEAREHLPPPLAASPASTLEAFSRAIALDSGFAPAYVHTVHRAMDLGWPDLARRYATTYAALGPTDASAASLLLVALLLDPASSQVRLSGLIDTVSASTLFNAGLEHLMTWTDSAETSVSLLRSLATGRHSVAGAAPWVADSLMWPQYLATALALRGHLHEAYEVDRRLISDPAASPFSLYLDPFSYLSLLGVVPESLASATFGRSLGPDLDWGAGYRFTARALRGLPWWYGRGDTSALAAFARRAERVASHPGNILGGLRARYYGAAAAAYLALARKDSAAALGLFAAIPDSLCLASNCFCQKLTEARLLSARGEQRAAAALLDRWIMAGAWEMTPLFVLGRLERGRIAEGLGEREKAMDAYRFVADIWRQADPELKPYVSEARAALERLTAE